MAETIEDLLARRTGAQLYGWKLALQASSVVGSLLAAEKNWNAQQTSGAIAEYSERLESYLEELALTKSKEV